MNHPIWLGGTHPDGRPLSNTTNVRIALEALGISARLNLFTERVEVTCSNPEVRERLLAAMDAPAEIPELPACDEVISVAEIPHD